MARDAAAYDLATIRKLLLAAFRPETLRRFCMDRPLFQPIVAQFGPGQGLDDMVDEVLETCRTRILWDELLAGVRAENPRQYARFAPDLDLPAQEASSPLDATAVSSYLEVVRRRHGGVETRPYRQLSELGGAPPRFALLGEEGRPGVYVPLRFDLYPRRSEVDQQMPDRGPGEGEELQRQMAREVSRSDVGLADVLGTAGHVVVVGGAGCGKTTILRLVATVLASQNAALAHGEWASGLEPWPLPVFVALRDFEHACRTQPRLYCRDVDGLLRFVDDHFQRWHPGRVPEGFVSGLVRRGRAWLLLDALDEVADFDHRIAVRQIIEGLADAFPGNRLLVTARVAAYSRVSTRLDERFQVATVRDLTGEEWVPLVERLYAGLEADPDVAAQRAGLLLARIEAAPLLQEMVKTPLMIWTATLIHYAERDLPEQRAELYRAYVDVLLGERLHEEESAEPAQRLREERWPQEDRRLYLSYAAYQTHQQAEAERAGGRGDALVVVDEQDLVRRILAPFLADYMGLDGRRKAEREAAAFVAFMAERSGLLHAHEEGYSFGDHLTVQEFLTASYLVDNVRGTGEWMAFLQARAGQSWWEEVFLLMAGYLLQWPQQARRFLLSELGKLPGDGEAHAYGLVWAGRALLEIPARRVGWHASARDELARALVKVLWQNPPTTPVAARVEAGDVLGRLGDPRFSGEWGLPEFLTIPGGRCWMGSEEAEVERLVQETGRDWFRRELPRHEVELDPFAVARYPTTQAMFQRFMEEGGYADGRWWKEAMADDRWREGKVKAWVGEWREGPAYRDDARLSGRNQPVVGVTWYEAAAYCRWLTAALDDGHRYRLPTEAEWERAARGPGGRRYPWGDEWDKEKANNEALKLGRSTPVGLFADGASAEGVLDLAGNVWEWCSDRYGEDTYRLRAGRVARNPGGPASGSSRILRGGSWYNDRDVVRCGSRYWSSPNGRYGYIGFRVARGPSR